MSDHALETMKAEKMVLKIGNSYILNDPDISPENSHTGMETTILCNFLFNHMNFSDDSDF
jgi:hypothetical protein